MSREIGLYRPLTVACHQCGQPIDGTTGMTMCIDCIKLTTNLTANVPREANVQFCRNCERYLIPPQTWVAAAPESRELLAILLKKLNGLQGLRLVDAAFIWTEPHSRRIKVKITVQGEAHGGVIVQETFEVEYMVLATQCSDCAKSFTVHTWRSCVQVRQKVQHKRTFLYLEQLILKHGAHANTVSIAESRDGIDFFFAQPGHAQKFLDFLSPLLPARSKRSEELISTDTHTGSSTYKFSHSVEIAPICREDLVVLPKQLANQMSNIARVVLCERVSSSLKFIDPCTLQSADLPGNIYWREPFPPLASQGDLVDFIVLDNEPLGPSHGRYLLSDVTVAKSSDMTEILTVRSHLGALLHSGDNVQGYYMRNCNFNHTQWDSLPEELRPDVVLVKKFYPNRVKARSRPWKLKRMTNVHNERIHDPENLGRMERDYEAFLQELEEDPELRETIRLYKDPETLARLEAQRQQQQLEEEDGPTIDMSELLDDLEDLQIADEA